MGRWRGAAQLRLPICTECRAEVPGRPLGEALLCRTLMLLICNLQARCFSVFLPPPSPPTPLSLISFFVHPPTSLPFASHILLCSHLLQPFFFSAHNPCAEEGGESGDKIHFIMQAMHIKRTIPPHWGRL